MQPTETQTFLESLFAECEAAGASDIHIGAGVAPRLRVHGVLSPIPGRAEVSPALCHALGIAIAASAMPGDCDDPVAESGRRLFSVGSIDGATTSPKGFRYRFNVFRENGAAAIALRRLDDEFLSLEQLGLPSRLADFCGMSDGLVIVTGPTGSGKSTTLATLINQINRTRDGHIITIEDPVEYVHKSKRCLVRQRQIGRDATGFYPALVESLRQDPDVVLVGEIREINTIRTAITAAETGHLVFTTLHAGDCVGAIERLTSVFPPGEQDGMRRQLSLVLRGIFAQHLLSPAQSGGRRVACGELMMVTPAIANLIATGKGVQIYSAIETGGALGMRSLEQSLAELFSAGKIGEQSAVTMARYPELLKDWLRSGAAKRTRQ